MVGADVPGGPRARCVRAGVPGVVPLARRAGDVAPYHGCGQDVGHGRGRHPRWPAYTMRPRGRPRCRPFGAARRVQFQNPPLAF